MTDYNVVWTDEAEAQLDELTDYIANDDPQAAARLYENVKTMGEGLKTSPARFRERDSGLRHALVDNITIRYIFNDQTNGDVVIADVVWGSSLTNID